MVLVGNSSFKLANFREGLIKILANRGCEVIAIAPRDGYSHQFANWQIKYIELPMDATGTSPASELLLLYRLLRIFRQERPNAALTYTIKPNIYGALAARSCGAVCLPNITGLGSAFDKQGLMSGLATQLYRLALRDCPRVFLQNPEDLGLFLEKRLARPDQALLLPGSGVDLTRFAQTPLPGHGPAATFLLSARMLRDKGVEVFAEAASTVKAEFPQARFQLLGPLVEGKASGLTGAELSSLTANGDVEYLGATQDVRPFLAGADCIVLPSFYREGTPRSLLEAAAMGRAIITTDTPGCRDVVEDGRNGFLCAPRDAHALAERMRDFIQLSAEERVAMGNASRRLASDRFDEAIVVEAYLEALGLS